MKNTLSIQRTKFKISFLIIFFLIITGCLFAQIKVACIGNSITAGYGLTKEQTYPAQMQILLGTKYEVRNFGVSARTLLKKGDHPYTDETAYKEALNWQPNIVIIKLGTNDTKPINWKYQNEFIPDYIDLVKSFKQLTSHPKVYVCYPIPVFEDKWGINDSTLIHALIPMVKTVAKKTNSRLIDLYSPFLGKANLVFDGIHPTADGAKYLSKLVEKSIR